MPTTVYEIAAHFAKIEKWGLLLGTLQLLPDDLRCLESKSNYPLDYLALKLDVLRPYVDRSARVKDAAEVLERILRNRTPTSL